MYIETNVWHDRWYSSAEPSLSIAISLMTPVNQSLLEGFISLYVLKKFQIRPN